MEKKFGKDIEKYIEILIFKDPFTVIKYISNYCSISLTKTQAESARDSLVKTLYSNFHEWMVQQINKKIHPSFGTDDPSHFIGILDMPGFGKFIDDFYFMIACTNIIL